MRRLIVLSALFVLIGSAVYAIQIQPWPPRPADLTVGAYAVTSPPVVHCGSQTIAITITESNIGTGPSGPYTTYHYSNGVAFCARSRPSLAAGATATYNDSCNLWNGPCDCIPTSYTIPFFARVDALGAVAESNEGNNQGPTVIKNAQCP